MARIGGVSSGRRTAFGGVNGRDLRPSRSDRVASIANTMTIGVETELKAIFPQLKASDLRRLAILLAPHVKNNFRDRFALELSAFTNATQLLKDANIKPRPDIIRNACRGGIQYRTFLELVLNVLYLNNPRWTDRSGLRREIVNALQGSQKRLIRVIKSPKSQGSKLLVQGHKYQDKSHRRVRRKSLPLFS